MIKPITNPICQDKHDKCLGKAILKLAFLFKLAMCSQVALLACGSRPRVGSSKNKLVGYAPSP